MSIDARAARRYDWAAVQAYYDAGHTVQQCRARFGFSTASWFKAVRRGVLAPRPTTMPIEQLLQVSRSRLHLKRRLLEAGLLTNGCSTCGIDSWREAPLALQLHHINGNRHDNRLENLALLCPNCHSQTDTWAGRNGRRRSARKPRAGPAWPDGEAAGPAPPA